MTLTVCHVRLLDSAIVGNIFSLGLLPLEIESGLLVVLVAVLVDYALGTVVVLLPCGLSPPIVQVSCDFKHI